MADQYVHSAPSIMMGRPVIIGTRITVELILEKLDAGKPWIKCWRPIRV